MAVQMRAMSSIASAHDQSNMLSSTSTQPLSAPFQENASALDALLQDLHGKIAGACEGGGAKAMERHRKRKKLPPRERIAALLDPGSPFLELSQLAGCNLYGDASLYTSCPSAALQTAECQCLKLFLTVRQNLRCTRKNSTRWAGHASTHRCLCSPLLLLPQGRFWEYRAKHLHAVTCNVLLARLSSTV